MVEEVEPLRERKSVFRQRRRLERSNYLIVCLVEPQRQIDHFPDILGFIQISFKLRVVEHLLDLRKIKLSVGLTELVENVVCTDCGVLDIRPGFSVKIQRFLEVEADDGCARN